MKYKLATYSLLSLFVCLFLFCSCKYKNVADAQRPIDSLIPEYAKGFSVYMYDGYKVININDPFTDSSIGRVYLSSRDTADSKFIRVPLSSAACMSSTHITFVDTLGSIDIIKGVSDVEYIFNKLIRNRVDNNEVVEIAQGMNINVEKILSIGAEAILTSPFKELSFSKLEESGVKVIPIADYLEPHPLGRLEWIKVIGLLLGKEQQADEIYQNAKNRYIEARQLAINVTDKPTIFDGANTWGTWYVSGGDSFMAYLYKDCGAEYVHGNNKDKASSVINFETLYAQCHDTDFWRVTLNRPKDFSLSDLQKEDPKYNDFKAIREGKVIFCNIDVCPLFEHGIIEPDVVLRDLIFAIHPELIPNHKPVYYTIIK